MSIFICTSLNDVEELNEAVIPIRPQLNACYGYYQHHMLVRIGFSRVEDVPETNVVNLADIPYIIWVFQFLYSIEVESYNRLLVKIILYLDILFKENVAFKRFLTVDLSILQVFLHLTRVFIQYRFRFFIVKLFLGLPNDIRFQNRIAIFKASKPISARCVW